MMTRTATSFFGGQFFGGEFFQTATVTHGGATLYDKRIMRDDEEALVIAALFITKLGDL